MLAERGNTMMKLKPIYKRGKFSVTPLVTFLQIEADGHVLYTYPVRDLEEAVSTCDELYEKEAMQPAA